MGDEDDGEGDTMTETTTDKHPTEVGFTCRKEWHGDMLTLIWRCCDTDAKMGQKQWMERRDGAMWREHRWDIILCERCGKRWQGACAWRALLRRACVHEESQ